MSDAERRARVERVIALGSRIADGSDSLGALARRSLAGTSGLSPEGLELALSEHLETHAAEADMSALLAGAGRAARCHVVLSANVCTAALRAIAVATATAPSVSVRPSRRDPVLAELLARELDRDEAFGRHGGRIAIVDELDPQPGDELHLYGSDSTVAAFAEALGPDVVLRGHGTGLGVALVAAGADLAAAAKALARDVVPFDQRGCLSPRLALVEGDLGRAEAFAVELHAALASLGSAVPRGALDAATLAEIALYVASIEAIGVLRAGPHHVVGLDPAPRSLLLPPAARVLHVAPVLDASQLGNLLAPWGGFITAMGVAGLSPAMTDAAGRLAPGARRSALGSMQRPPLDGPVDLRRVASRGTRPPRGA